MNSAKLADLRLSASGTPLLRLADDLYLKDETASVAGSFKLRGVLKLVDDARETASGGVATVSSGNTGLAATLVAEAMGIPCRVWLPKGADLDKRSALAELGATIVDSPHGFARTAQNAALWAEEHSALFVSPGTSASFVAGLLPIFAELEKCLDGIRTIYIPCGGGGLLTAAVWATRDWRKPPNLIGVQAWSSRPVHDLRYGLQNSRTDASYADSISGELERGALVVPVIQEVSEVRLVTRKQLLQARKFVYAKTELIPDLGACAGLAAHLKEPKAGTTVVLLTGRAVTKTSDRRTYDN